MSQSRRVALNALALRPRGGGVNTYIREVVASLVDEVDAELVVSVQQDAVDELPPSVQPRVAPVVAGVRRAARAVRAPEAVDLVHGLDVAIPAGTSLPTVATIHDLSVYDVPWSFRRRHVAGKRLQLRHAARTAATMIAVSEFTADRVRDRLGRDAVVVHLAPSKAFAPPTPEVVAEIERRYDLRGPFVLHVGVNDPRKDLSLLAQACDAAAVTLVLAGPPGRAGVPTGARVRALGYVPQEDLAGLYGAATIVGYPSRYEGFGLPPLEAMACRAPVVASKIPPLVEVLGSAAELVPPSDVERWAAALTELLADSARRDALAERGRAHARTYDWAQTARGTADVYRSLGVSV